MKKTVRIYVKAKGAEKEFQKGMGKGVLAYQDIEFDLTEEEYNSTRFASTIVNAERRLLEEMIETSAEFVDSDKSEDLGYSKEDKEFHNIMGMDE